MDDQTWWKAQMSGEREKYKLCSGGFDASGAFVHDGRHCACDKSAATDQELLSIADRKIVAVRRAVSFLEARRDWFKREGQTNLADELNAAVYEIKQSLSGAR